MKLAPMCWAYSAVDHSCETITEAPKLCRKHENSGCFPFPKTDEYRIFTEIVEQSLCTSANHTIKLWPKKMLELPSNRSGCNPAKANAALITMGNVAKEVYESLPSWVGKVESFHETNNYSL